MQYLTFLSIIAYVSAALVFPQPANAAIRNLGQSMKAATDEIAHNSIVILKDGGTKTFHNTQLKPGRALIINEAT